MAVTQQDPQAIAQAWASRLGASTDKITAGVNAVSVAPGQAAARNKTGYIQGVQNAADKWAKNTAGVSLQDWQASMLNKGVNRIGSGATAAVPKMATFMGKLLPYQRSLVSQLPARGDLGANVQRMVAFVQGMAKFSATS